MPLVVQKPSSATDATATADVASSAEDSSCAVLAEGLPLTKAEEGGSPSSMVVDATITTDTDKKSVLSTVVDGLTLLKEEKAKADVVLKDAVDDVDVEVEVEEELDELEEGAVAGPPSLDELEDVCYIHGRGFCTVDGTDRADGDEDDEIEADFLRGRTKTGSLGGDGSGDGMPAATVGILGGIHGGGMHAHATTAATGASKASGGSGSGKRSSSGKKKAASSGSGAGGKSSTGQALGAGDTDLGTNADGSKSKSSSSSAAKNKAGGGSRKRSSSIGGSSGDVTTAASTSAALSEDGFAAADFEEEEEGRRDRSHSGGGGGDNEDDGEDSGAEGSAAGAAGAGAGATAGGSGEKKKGGGKGSGMKGRHPANALLVKTGESRRRLLDTSLIESISSPPHYFFPRSSSLMITHPIILHITHHHHTSHLVHSAFHHLLLPFHQPVHSSRGSTHQPPSLSHFI
jgi:hypothetical protein